MLSKNQVRHIQALRQKKQRELQRRFVAEGSKLVLDLLGSRYEVQELFATASWICAQGDLPALRKIKPLEVTEEELSRITSLSTAGPVLAVVSIPDTELFSGDADGKLILALDEISDPGNLGTIIRIADWFGIDGIVCSENTVELYNPKVVQATMGSIARVPVIYRGLETFLETQSPGTVTFGTFLDGENVYEADLPREGIIVIGSEARGISGPVAGRLTRKLHIPSFSGKDRPAGGAESLNASVATAVICSEFRRRNR